MVGREMKEWVSKPEARLLEVDQKTLEVDAGIVGEGRDVSS